MPWNENGPSKRSSYDIAFKRMKSAEKSFQRKECLVIANDEVQKLLEQDFVIKLPTEEVDHTQPEWYLPLQAVFTPERTTKIRLVFDASSKGHDSLSLNDHLEKGPNYLNSLPNVLMAWRWNEVAYSGDIRKMFNQVLVYSDDQVFHRFLCGEGTKVYRPQSSCGADYTLATSQHQTLPRTPGRGTPTAQKLTSLVARDLHTCLAKNEIKKKTSLPSRKKTW